MQPKLAARVRLLHTENTGKSDPGDALSVAVAALRSKAQRPVIIRHQPHRGLRRRPGRRRDRHRRCVTVTRFPTRDHFAACNGTAPVEVSSGEKKIYRLSLRGNRRFNHAIHMAAITQISHEHTDGRAYYQRKVAEGKTHKEALRCLKRRISNAGYARLRADARKGGPGGQPGSHSVSRAAG